MLRKKIFKILSVLVAVIIAFSLFTIPASAEEQQTLFSDFWTLNTSDSKVWHIETTTGGTLTDITSSVQFNFLSDGKILGVNFKTNQDWGAHNILYFNFVFDLKPQYCTTGVSSLKFSLGRTSRMNFTGTAPNVITGVRYLPWAYRDGNYYVNGISVRDYQDVKTEPKDTSITYNFENYNAKYGFNRVCVFAYCTLTQSLSSNNYRIYFEFHKLDYRYSTEGEYLNQQIINNQNVNTDKIIANAEKNASDIQANQDKNTDKILNGGSDNPHYSSTDTTVTDDYHSKEQEVFNQTASARSSTVNFFNNFGALLNDTPVQRGLLAVSKIMTEFFSIGWLSGIIQFALALGAFAFILGSVIMVVGRLSSRESRSARSEYYKSKTAYYNSRRKK